MPLSSVNWRGQVYEDEYRHRCMNLTHPRSVILKEQELP